MVGEAKFGLLVFIIILRMASPRGALQFNKLLSISVVTNKYLKLLSIVPCGKNVKQLLWLMSKCGFRPLSALGPILDSWLWYPIIINEKKKSFLFLYQLFEHYNIM